MVRGLVVRSMCPPNRIFAGGATYSYKFNYLFISYSIHSECQESLQEVRENSLPGTKPAVKVLKMPDMILRSEHFDFFLSFG